MNAATCTGGTRANTYAVTYTGSTFSFARATASCSPATCGTRQFRLVWSSALSTIRAVLRAPSNAPAPAWNTNPNPPSAQVFVDQGLGNGPFATADARIMLLTRASTDSFIQTYDPDGTAGASPSRDVRHYLLRANRLWNGQTVSVTSAGLACGITNGAPASAPTVPFVRLQQVAACGGATVGAPVTFYYAGGNFTGNQQCVDNAADNADMLDVHLNRCDDPDTTLQLASVQTSLRPELVLSGSSIAGYSESNDGVYMGITAPTVGGIPAQGNTPIAGSLKRLKDRFDVMWANDQTPGTLQLPTDTLVVPAPASRYDIDAISTHNNPKEPTIVIFVTDGDDTCAIESGSTNNNALAAAWQAQRLYTPIVGSLQANGQYAANHRHRVIGHHVRHRLWQRRLGDASQLDRLGRQRHAATHDHAEPLQPRTDRHGDSLAECTRVGDRRRLCDVSGRPGGTRRRLSQGRALLDHQPGRQARRVRGAAVGRRLRVRVRRRSDEADEPGRARPAQPRQPLPGRRAGTLREQLHAAGLRRPPPRHHRERRRLDRRHSLGRRAQAEAQHHRRHEDLHRGTNRDVHLSAVARGRHRPQRLDLERGHQAPDLHDRPQRRVHHDRR